MSTTPTTSARRFVIATNNGYDTLLIAQGDTVISAWEMTDAVLAEFLASNGDCSAWDDNYPAHEAVSDYGQEVTADELLAKIEARKA